ncbi:MAG: transcriptional regulator, TetR family [Dactylosporangium sp.]|nr:transcriptional regulator, TetR family [Dactylosporangium sp.]
MTPARPLNGSTSRRRLPTQHRSRERVERILDVAADLITEHGVADLSTRAIATRADVPVASLYQYFADKEEIVLALVERDIGEMDEQVAQAVTALETLSVRTVVEATMRAFVAVYHHRPAFGVIWWHDRTNAAVMRFCRQHNKQVAKYLFEFATNAGLLRPDTDPIVAELGVEVGDRVFQVAFEQNLSGDKHVIDEGVELVVAYLERYATPAGIAGIPPGSRRVEE